MGRPCLLIAILAFCLGCRSPNCWGPYGGQGTRVPPPPTGSYGVPNNYYQPSFPANPAPTLPPGVRPLSPTTQWRTVPAEGGMSTAAALVPSPAGSSDPTVTPPTVASVPATVRSELSQQLKGMPVNEALGSAEPALVTPDENAAPLTSVPRVAKSAAPRVGQPAPVGGSDPRRAVTSASWQTREEP
ncbi:MAG: hypothetical protein AB7F89_03365 [Pirellulaceae bacterium]